MRKEYRLPIQGKVLNDEPLTGDEKDPISPINIRLLPDFPTYYNENLKAEIKRDCFVACLDYNVDEEWCEAEIEAEQEVHDWLQGILPQLETIKVQKGWKLDKTELEKVRLARKGI